MSDHKDKAHIRRLQESEVDLAEAYAASERLNKRLARAILSLAEDAGMPDSYMETDRRTRLARKVIGKETV